MLIQRIVHLDDNDVKLLEVKVRITVDVLCSNQKVGVAYVNVVEYENSFDWYLSPSFELGNGNKTEAIKSIQQQVDTFLRKFASLVHIPKPKS